MNALITREFNAVTIPQRQEDGYVNLTAMAKATGKFVGNYRQMQGTSDFLTALSSDIGIPISLLVVSVKGVKAGGDAQMQGTWAHPQVAINFATWASPEFAVAVSKWVYEWITGKSDVQICTSLALPVWERALDSNLAAEDRPAFVAQCRKLVGREKVTAAQFQKLCRHFAEIQSGFERRLLEILDTAWFVSPANHGRRLQDVPSEAAAPDYWEGTSTRLASLLGGDTGPRCTHKEIVRPYLPALGRHLGTLARLFPGRVHSRRLSMKRVWRIYRAAPLALTV